MAERLTPAPEPTVSRRDFLRRSATVGTGLFASQIPDLRYLHSQEYRPFHPSQLGITIDVSGIRWLGLDVQKTVDEFLTHMSADHVRVALPFDQIYKSKNAPADFSAIEPVLNQVKKREKRIHAQFGIKTFGWPEIHLPGDVLDEFGYIRQEGGQIDKDPKLQEWTLQKLTEVGRFVLPYLDENDTYQVENEIYKVRVARGRFISQEFNAKEHEVIKSLDHLKEERKTIGNIPIHNPREWFASRSHVYTHNQIVGINLYPQHNEVPFPDSLVEAANWAAAIGAAIDARNHGLEVFITEHQAAQWRGSKIQFDIDKGIRDFQKSKEQINPSVTMIWDLQQAYAERLRGNPAHFEALTRLGIPT